jgi:TM2 domain-containing membrane protein YozV
MPGHAQGYYPPHGQPQQMIMAPPKSKVTALLLALFLGPIGIHRFYLGHAGTGVAMLLLVVCTWGAGVVLTVPWAIIDLIMIATGGLKDSSGQDLA